MQTASCLTHQNPFPKQGEFEMTHTPNRSLWSDDYLVFADAKDSRSLAIMRDCTAGQAAINSYNFENLTEGPRASYAVRIQTFEGTLTKLITLEDPTTLAWARDGETDGALLAREIAKELGVKLPAKRKVAAPK